VVAREATAAKAGGSIARAMAHIQLTATLVSRGPAVAVVLDDEQVAAVGEGAKREDTRRRRVDQALEMLRAGKTRS
jgi:hypothetical protein